MGRDSVGGGGERRKKGGKRGNVSFFTSGAKYFGERLQRQTATKEKKGKIGLQKNLLKRRIQKKGQILP